MAFTNTRLVRNIEGNKVVEYWNVTADANSGSVITGLSVVEAVFGYTAISITTAAPAIHFRPNISAASAAANGSIMVSSCTNGDNFIIVAVGH